MSRDLQPAPALDAASSSTAAGGARAGAPFSCTTPTPAPKRRIPKAGTVDLAARAQREAVPLTFGELVTLYDLAHPDKAANKTDIARKWVENFGLGPVLAWAVTREQLEAGASAMVKDFGYAIGTVNRDLSKIGTIFIWAAKEKLTPAGFTSPTLGMQREIEPMRYVEPARPGEWERMRAVAKGVRDPLFTLLVWLGMDTGARRGELSERVWTDFDLDAPEGPNIVLEHLDTKTGRARRLYFSNETAQLVRRLRPAESYRHKLVFVSKRGKGVTPNAYRHQWRRFTTMIGRPGLHFHDLRHMVAAELLKAGKGMSQVAQLLGHSSLVLHRRYGHLDDAAVRDMQAERLGLDKGASTERQTVLDAISQARTRHEHREMSAADDALAEAQRLQLVANEAMAAALAAAHALTGMRGAPNASPARRPAAPAPGPLEHLLATSTTTTITTVPGLQA